ncbi:hypothetical protein [Abyssisolibacter fermentans]|uniref:hypothetical protein n=1 Tax=Abyssisolibacter fermentans TaxID=1766203 RepID=UPI00082B46D3|nr:hypothetical protein [Abyssisolibacter fermentans]
MKTNTIELGVNIKSCRDCKKEQELSFEAIRSERDVFAEEIEDLLTRIDILMEERDVAEDKLEDAEMKVYGIKRRN